eukprot:TRINITY_DN2569_c1_g1_i1.p1 TRINITY_DN2569_c1_g1~~TRINITY_DN2569_c1_g1_i1.p1  ORF type:complete len:217 (-),score=56.93 TRINITY_DN2569_c1_g1_i1:55-705(-)
MLMLLILLMLLKLLQLCTYTETVAGDEDTHALKGTTVMDQEQRAESVSHCKYADEVICPCPWIITPEFIEEHQIDFVCHGQDICYDENGNDIYQFVKDAGKYRVIGRTEGVSTSDIIRNIVRDYDVYLRRNLKRGYDRKDLNISWTKEQTIKAKEAVSDGFRTGLEIGKGKLNLWKENTDNFITGFLQRFDQAETWENLKQIISPHNSMEEDSSED